MQIATLCILHFIVDVCVKLYTRIHAWSDATHVFHLHTCVTHVRHAQTVTVVGDLYRSYNVFSVVLVFSILSLGCILISDLIANLLMYSLPDMILLYLAAPFFTPKVFLDEIHTYMHTYICVAT